MPYYVIVSIPYEGAVITEYNSIGPARRDYFEYANKVKLDTNGKVADDSEFLGTTLLRGEAILEKGDWK